MIKPCFPSVQREIRLGARYALIDTLALCVYVCVLWAGELFRVRSRRAFANLPVNANRAHRRRPLMLPARFQLQVRRANFVGAEFCAAEL